MSPGLATFANIITGGRAEGSPSLRGARSFRGRPAAAGATVRPTVPRPCSRLEVLLALRRREDPEDLAVLRDGAARDLDPLDLQDLHDLLVGVGMLRILGRDDLLDVVLDRLARDLVAAGAVDRRVEEELELVDALGRVDVLVRGPPRDGGLVHADVLGAVPEDERLR